MKSRKVLLAGMGALSLAAFGCGLLSTNTTGDQINAEAVKPSEPIVAAAEVDTGHPEVEPGLSCNDCHEIKLDAQTTATQVYLFDDSPGHAKGEGVYPKERVWADLRVAAGARSVGWATRPESRYRRVTSPAKALGYEDGSSSCFGL